MRVSLHIDSASDAEMKRAVLAWHFTTPMFKTPLLALDGMTVKVCGCAWTVDSPPIETERASLILQAAESNDGLKVVEHLRDSHGEVKNAWRQYLDGEIEELKEV
jgi:hypothetical protein